MPSDPPHAFSGISGFPAISKIRRMSGIPAPSDPAARNGSLAWRFREPWMSGLAGCAPRLRLAALDFRCVGFWLRLAENRARFRGLTACAARFSGIGGRPPGFPRVPLIVIFRGLLDFPRLPELGEIPDFQRRRIRGPETGRQLRDSGRRGARIRALTACLAYFVGVGERPPGRLRAQP